MKTATRTRKVGEMRTRTFFALLPVTVTYKDGDVDVLEKRWMETVTVVEEFNVYLEGAGWEIVKFVDQAVPNGRKRG